jgi:hypothetical protein
MAERKLKAEGVYGSVQVNHMRTPPGEFEKSVNAVVRWDQLCKLKAYIDNAVSELALLDHRENQTTAVVFTLRAVDNGEWRLLVSEAHDALSDAQVEKRRQEWREAQVPE